MREWLTGLFLGALFAATVVNQLPIKCWARFVSRHDSWSFLPFWAFFAPEPGYAATHLVYRDWGRSGWTAWTELEIPDTTGWRWIWNPGRYERKAVQDFLNGMVRASHQLEDPRALELTSCYLGVAAWVEAQAPLDEGVERRQFAVLQAIGHSGARELKPVVVSREYSID